MPQHPKHIVASKWFRALTLIAFSLLVLSSMTAFEVVDCRVQAGKPADPTKCDGVIGGAGDNHITVDQNQTVTGPFFGDGVGGNGGDDVIINNGTTVSLGGSTGRNGDIEGDVATGNGGDDVIVNNGIVAGDTDGDTVLGNGGDDVLINNGHISDDMDGDNALHSGGDDLIINNGTMGGDMQADDNEDKAGSVGGDDTLVINGTIEGSVDGDAGVKKGGDDLIILQNGANGGTDHALYINGNDGDDTLVFNFTVADQTTFDTLSQQIKDAHPASGSLTFNGQTFEWENFEHLDNKLVLMRSAGITVITTGNKIRAVTGVRGTAAYCLADKLTVVGLDMTKHAEWLFTIKSADLKAALAKATSTKIALKVAQADGQMLFALASGEFNLQDAIGRYSFNFSGETCTA